MEISEAELEAIKQRSEAIGAINQSLDNIGESIKHINQVLDDAFEKFVSEHHQVLLPYLCQRKDFLNLGIPPASSNDASRLNLLLSNNQS